MTDTRRVLPVRIELVRQLRRRRTWVALGLCALVPVLIALAFWIGGPPGNDQDQTFLATLAVKSGINFTLFVLSVASALLLAVVAALFAGDTIASEASWGSLRYLLALPVRRQRLLRQKLIVALATGLVAVLLLTLVSLALGTVAYGWHGIQTPTGQQISMATSLQALAIVTGYIALTILPIAAAAFCFSTMTDAPLAAVGGAVGIVILSNILDAITSLHRLRDVLPTHYGLAWMEVLQIPPVYGDIKRGSLCCVVWTACFLALAWAHFTRKDIVS